MRIGKVALAVALVLACGDVCSVAAQTPAAQTPAATPQQAPARGGRGARGAGAGTAPPPNFPEQQRQLASTDVITRGKAVFGVNCVPCHGSDLRGGDLGGPNLVRSQLAMTDQHGELIGPIIHGARQDKGMPQFNLSPEDTTAVAEYIHSVLAATGAQGRPPGAPDGDDLKVIVGDPVAGKAYFDKTCTTCHSLTGDLKGIGATTDARALQNTWVAGIVGSGRGAQGGSPTTVTVTLANGTKVQGSLVRKDDFIATLIEADGTRRTFSRNVDVKSVDVTDPHEAHKKLEMTVTDKEMHDVTAYLATVK